MRTFAPLMLLLAVLLTGCAAPAPERPFTVAAASDLQFAFTEIGERFEARTGHKVLFMFGSTGNLAKQIEHGAPIDLYAAANVAFVEDLVRKGLLIPETQQIYAQGRLALASHKRSGVNATDLSRLLNPGIKRIAIANPEHAPYGAAAREALISAGLWEQVQPKLVFGENVRQALQFVQTGNAEVGFVALSIAEVPEITYVLVDTRLYQPLNQALAVVKGSPREQLAREFAAFVTGPEGQSVMQRYGFTAPGQ